MSAQTQGAAVDVDEIAVERACRGDHSVSLNPAEVMAALDQLARRQASVNNTAALLGTTPYWINLWRSGVTPPTLRPGRGMTDNDDALYRAKNIADKRIQRAATKARAALADLAALLSEWDAKAEARAEIERLEEELAEAKAKLRGPRKARSNGYDAAAVRRWAAANKVECSAHGRVPEAVVEKWKAATTR